MFYDIIAEIKDERIILSYCFGRRYGVLLASVTVFINFIKIFIFIDDFYKLMCYYSNCCLPDVGRGADVNVCIHIIISVH